MENENFAGSPEQSSGKRVLVGRKTKNSFQCEFCDKSFTRKYGKNKHVETMHGVPKEISDASKSFKCDICSKLYQYKKTLDRHLKKAHPGFEDSGKPSQSCWCTFCSMPFSGRKSLYDHMRGVHGFSSDESATEDENMSVERLKHLNEGKISCPSCSASFPTYQKLSAHLCSEHGYIDHVEELTFKSMNEFSAWKVATEMSKICFFVKNQSAKKVSSGTRNYYFCHRSGVFESKGSGERIHRRDTVKLDAMCPARMMVTQVEDTIQLVYHSQHYGHENCVSFLKLTEAERQILAEKLKHHASFESIIDDIRDSVLEQQHMSRLGLVECRDLWNLSRSLNLKKNRAHNNDAVSVEFIVNKLCRSPNNPVLFYKLQNCEDQRFTLNYEDFMLVICTPYQQKVLSEFMNQRVLVDSTHGTNGYNFQLTTLVSIDECGSGVPVAYCLSNRIDSDTMESFFILVKDALGRSVETEVFMSDRAEQYYNAWKNVMGPSKHQLYCTWHVDRNWRAQLKKVNGQENQLEVYRSCRVLLTMADEELFQICLQQFVEMLLADEDTKAFGKYFETHYASCPEKWAYCFRAGLGLNTNMFLEALHKKLKYTYMHGKQLRRIDECLHILLRFTRDIAFERLTRHCKGNNSYRQSAIVASHKESMNITEDMVKEIEPEMKWTVKAKSRPGNYIVEVVKDNTCLGCELACPRCHVCKHQFKCTCNNHRINDNICKHIHACVQISESQGNVTSDAVTASQVTNDIEAIMESLSTETHNFSEVSQADVWKPLMGKIKYLVDKVDGSDVVIKASLKYLEILSKAAAMNVHSLTDSVPELAVGSKGFRTPNNKNVLVQRKGGFYSTKKSRTKVEFDLSLPTYSQEQNAVAFLVGNNAV